MNQITVQDMKQLQNDNKNLFAQTAIPLLQRHLQTGALSGAQQQYWQQLRQWSCENNAGSKEATVFYLTWSNLKSLIWDDDLLNRADKAALVQPQETTTLLWLLRDSSMHFIDNIHTPQQETLSGLVQQAFTMAADSAQKLEQQRRLEWGRFRGTDIRHLSRSLPAFSQMHLFTGGGTHIVNATKDTHGPSWRMVVQLGPQTEAYGIYPGGQSGNPGSQYYDNSVKDWVEGKYYLLRVFDREHGDDPGIRFRMVMEPGG
jgi:penicillin amidase